MSPPTPRAQTLVVAGLWVRPMAQSARRAGWNVIGLDLFGDQDTREACVEWRRIGDPSSMTIDRTLLRDAVKHIGSVPDCVLGSGFEGRPELFAEVQAQFTVIGTTAERATALRDPRRWFDTLDRCDLGHPPVAFGNRVPDTLHGRWLAKDARGSGGWHIHEATPGMPLARGEYLQQQAEGQSMSALFLADGTRACIVGSSAQDVRPLRTMPFVYRGAIGPIDDDVLTARVQRGLDALVPAFGLVGLASADVLVTSRGIAWLEINPRPSATMLLYDEAWPHGLMHAHVQACAGHLPDDVPRCDGMTGHRIVFAEHDVTIHTTTASAWAQHPWCHDRPMPGTRVAAGEPLCSVSARAGDEAALRHALDTFEQRAADAAGPAPTTNRR